MSFVAYRFKLVDAEHQEVVFLFVGNIFQWYRISRSIDSDYSEM